jgi:hypothetical protein
MAQRFDTEFSLVDEFAKQIAPLKYETYREFDSSYGIADIVLFRRIIRGINYTNLGALPERWAYTLRNLPYRKLFSTAEFSTSASVAASQARKLLSGMAQAGYIRQSDDSDIWIKVRQPLPITNEIIAIEAKLTKWKSALSQATRYRHFAHQSWVLLDSRSRGGAIDNLQDFQRFNIGLMSIDRAGSLFVHFSPAKAKPKSPQLFWMANVRLAKKLIL